MPVETYLREQYDLPYFCDQVEHEDHQRDEENDQRDDLEALRVIVIREQVQDRGRDGRAGDDAVPLPREVPRETPRSEPGGE